ncbi:MAG: asparaginase domain-containing protein [Marinagarivorans sp.]|nr:asparaginase domain-containing protein [Marinagarivorans sp.]
MTPKHHKQKTLGVIYTGGTIGMESSENGLVASGDFDKKLKFFFPQFFNNPAIQLKIKSYPQPIDSSHANFDLAVNLQQNILTSQAECESFLVIMGTDTLTFMSACLAFLLHQKNIPVIVTGAMHPLTANASDAIANVNFALDLLIKKEVQGVNVVFAGKLFPATRCTKLFTQTNDAIVNTTAPKQLPAPIQPLHGLQLPAMFNDVDIRVIRVLPSLHQNYVNALFAGKPVAVIIQCYGSGTVPSENSAFAHALKQAANNGVPIFAIVQAQCSWVDFGTYAAAGWIAKVAVPCGDMNLEATYAKLWVLLNGGVAGENLKAAMPMNLCGEISVAALVCDQ